jgi:hypothetical protein
VRLEHGIISSSVFIRVQGYSTDQGLLEKGKQEGEIDGLNNKDAQALSDFINKKLDVTTPDDQTTADDSDERPGGFIYCNSCGERNPISSKFCSKCGAKL